MCLGISARDGSGSRPWTLHRADERLKICPSGALHFNSSREVLAASQSGLGVACVLDLIAAPLLEEGSLVAVYPHWQTMSRTLGARTRPGLANSVNARAFIRFVREILSPDYKPPAAVRVKRTVTSDPAARWAQLLRTD